MSEELAIYNAPKESLSLVDVQGQVQLIQNILHGVMQDGQHFGKIPGTDKPTLLKAGAEKLCLTFRLDPEYEATQTFDGDHLTVVSKCTLYHISSGNRLGSGEGMCSTKESKYGYRNANRKCPNCEQETIFTDKKGNGYYCWAKKGGCGKTFTIGDESIEKQKIGKVPNEYLADQYNTVLKMANKRSLVAAVLNVTAASDIFTQDMEDIRPEPEAKKEPVQERVATENTTTGATAIEVLESSLDEVARTGSLKELEQWWKDNFEAMKALSKQEQTALTKAFANAKKNAQ